MTDEYLREQMGSVLSIVSLPSKTLNSDTMFYGLKDIKLRVLLDKK